MRQAAKIFAGCAFIGAAGVSLAGGWAAVRGFEQMTLATLNARVEPEADAWASIAVDGLQVFLSGEAPSETDRFQFLRRVTAVVPSSRLRDQTTIAEESTAIDPDYSLQVLRDQGDISLIGLVPVIPDLPPIAGRITDIAPGANVTNMLERVERTPPDLWQPALSFGLSALADLDQAKLSVRPGEVTLAGVVPDQERLDALQAQLQAALPEGVTLNLDLSAPRRVISPYRFHATVSAQDGIRLEVCTVETAADAEIVHQAVDDASVTCTIGLGAPTTDWTDTVRRAIASLGELTSGEVDITDARMHLVAGVEQDREAFATVATALEATLVAPYSLTRELPPLPPPVDTEGAPIPPRFEAIHAEDGTTTLSGDMPNEFLQTAAQTFARAQFGHDGVADASTVREGLPADWSSRAVAGIGALAMLDYGTFEMTEGIARLTGASTALPVADTARDILASAMPQSTRIVINVDLIEKPVQHTSGVVFPQDLCGEQISIILDRNQINFPPSETEIEEASLPIIDEIARVLQNCPGARFEIAGHTDSQGRESSNLALSQARADSVLQALIDRDINLVFLTTRGYGEAEPIAENDTEEGRAANRRIEFRLLDDTGAEPEPEPSAEIAQDDTDSAVDAVDLLEEEASPEPDAEAPTEDGPAEDAPAADSSGTEATEDADAAPAVEDEAPAEPEEPVTAGTDDADAPATEERNTSGNFINRPRPRPQRLPQISQDQ